MLKINFKLLFLRTHIFQIFLIEKKKQQRRMFSSTLNITWLNSSHENNVIIQHTSSLTIVQRIIFILSIVSEFMKRIKLPSGMSIF
jgi:hypothetical protein